MLDDTPETIGGRSLALDHVSITVIVDNETDTLSSVDAGVPQAPESMWLVANSTVDTEHDGHPCLTVFDRLCVACHGLSLLVEGRVGDRRATVLFDVGPYPDVWLANAARLQVELAAIDTIFLSHWHWDHSGALPEVIAAISEARARAGKDPQIVVDLHPERPDQRGLMTPTGTFLMLPPEPTWDAIRDAGGTIELHAEPHLVGGGHFFASGAIPRVTAYETGLPGHHSLRGGDIVPDPLITDERYLAVDVRGRGVTVLSACSHAGIVNACLSARAQYPESPVDLVLGGYHLAGASMEQRIAETVRDLDELVAPLLVAPAHCTGWRAKAALAQRFAPGRYAPSAVGTRFALDGTG